MEPAFEKASSSEEHKQAQRDIHRAGPAELGAAYEIVAEYYEAARVVARDGKVQFGKEYFFATAGVWLAKVEGQIAGCIALRALGDTGKAEIKRMYVRPEWRGQGLAQALLEEAERFAREAGYRWIYLDTTDEMQQAAKLYRRKGYELCERYNDNPQATIFMRKELKS